MKHNCYMKYSIIVLLLFLISCSGNKEDYVHYIDINDFPKKISPKYEEYEVPPVLLKPSRLIIIDTLLLVYQGRPDTIFSLFKLPECSFITSFGIKGRGPDEFSLVFPNSLGPVYGNQSINFAVGNITILDR